MQEMTAQDHSKTKIKICGLRRREDILAVNEAKPDYCGFIIEFPKSFRSVTADQVRELVKELAPEIQPVGVFVNAPMELVRTLLDDGTLALAQLHGQENESYIRELKTYTDKPIIKAFSIALPKDLLAVFNYEGFCDYYLFDTRTVHYGGSGQQFDWSILQRYTGSTPFLLSGGINSYSVKALKEFHHPRLTGIDINSRFETSPGIKDVERIERFLKELRTN